MAHTLCEAELPTGTVTFLFTDIEGSTRLLKHLGEGYGAVLADHQRLLREAFETHGGREIDTQGEWPPLRGRQLGQRLAALELRAQLGGRRG